MIALGTGLLVLWLVGINHSADTVSWLDFVGGALSIIGGAALAPRVARGVHVGEPLVLALGLFALWVAALFLDVPLWKAWWNFAFACAYLVLAVAAAGSETWYEPRSI